MASKIRALVTEAKWRGIWGTVRAVKMNKFGTMENFVASDHLGNRYFENRKETWGRHRWVEYSEDKNYDSLRIPPDWHAWLHHNAGKSPTEKPLDAPHFQVEATGNKTGTKNAYVPPHHRMNKSFEGLAKEKYESWDPSGAPAVKDTTSKDVLDLK